MNNEDHFVEEILRDIDYDLYKEILIMEEEDEEQSEIRINIKITLDNYYNWRKANA